MSEREISAEVKGTLDLGEFMAAAAAAGVTVTMYPRELINGEPAELLGLSAVLELPAGSIASDEDMEKADYVIVGGVVVKNRNGPVYSFERGREAHAMVHLGTKFDIGQRVGFRKQAKADESGDVVQGAGEVWAITQYKDREPHYLVRPDEGTQKLLEHDHDVGADEGELHALDQVAEDPDAGRQAELAREESPEAAELLRELHHVDCMMNVLGRPFPHGDVSITDIGIRAASQIQKSLIDEYRVKRVQIVAAIMSDDAETGRHRTWMP